MARTIQDLEAYLQASGRPIEKTDETTFVLVPRAEIQPLVAVMADGPVVIITVAIGPAPKGTAAMQAGFFRRLLELNATDLLYCSYGLRGDNIILSSAHELENLDMNELLAILADIDLALNRHIKELVALSEATGEGLTWEFLPASRSSSRPTSTT